MRHVAYLFALILLCGCSQESLLQKFSSVQDQAIAKSYIDKLRTRDFDAIENAADQSIKSPTLRNTLVQMANQIPNQEPTSVKLVGAKTFHMASTTTVNTTFEYKFGPKWLIANVAIQDKKGVKTIVGFNVNPEPSSLESQNRFSLFGKSAVQYCALSAAIAAALLTLYSLIVCIRTKLSGKNGRGFFSSSWASEKWRSIGLPGNGVSIYSLCSCLVLPPSHPYTGHGQ